MQHRTAPPRRHLRSAGILAAGLALVTLAGCGSSGGDASKEKPTELCAAVERYDEAMRAGDRTAAADALAASVAGLPDEDQRNVEAYVLALRGAPASFPKPDEDGVSYARTQGSFDDYVAEQCGEDALAPADEGTTSTTAATGDQGSGSDGSMGGGTDTMG
jgi:hypothetical protein